MARPKKAITIVERRLQSGSIFGTSSKPIPLTEPSRWTVRIVNSQISDSHLYQMQADKGWVYASPEDLAVKAEEIGFRELDGRIVRGTQGQEVLMKMERADYAAVSKAKDAANRKQTFGKKATKDAIVGALHANAGDEVTTKMERALNTITVQDSLETVSLDD